MNYDPSYYDSTEIVVGRLNDNLNGFSSWLQVTDNAVPDYFPDVWIDVVGSLPLCNKSFDTSQYVIQAIEADEQLTILTPLENELFQTSDSIKLNWHVKKI